MPAPHQDGWRLSSHGADVLKYAFAAALVAVSVECAASVAVAATASSRVAGPSYTGLPDLGTAAALTYAGGGGKVYATRRAFNAIIGVQLFDPEVRNLERRYGVAPIAQWMHVSTYVVKDAVRRGSEEGVHLPLPPGALVGKRLMQTLVHDGTAHDGAFWTGYWLDRLFSHRLHAQVAHDVRTHFGHSAEATFNRVNNRAFYDLDHQTGGSVGLASFH